MAVYGPSGQEELYHWKYKYKKKINGKWRYYYDDVNLDPKKYKNLKDAENLEKEVSMYRTKYAAEVVNSRPRSGWTPQSVKDDIATSIEMARYYRNKWKYYDSVYQKVLDQLGEDTMKDASLYMVNTWDGHAEFKEKYLKKLEEEAQKEAEEEEKQKAKEKEEYAHEQGFKSYAELEEWQEERAKNIEIEKKRLALAQKLEGVQKRNPKKKKGGR